MSQRAIVRFWLPLLGSWLLLTLEGPLITLVINRLPQPVLMLAAMGIVLALSVFIESPIINLLATSTAKVADRPGYLLVRRFTVQWMVLLTAIALLVAFTPLFDLIVVRGMGISAEIADQVRTGMRINFLWSAAIAWRRFLQGVLIRFNQTRAVAVGTLLRLISGATVAISLALLTTLPGVVIGSLTLTVGVIAEAIYATLAARSAVRALNPAVTVPLTWSELFWFHLPLGGSSVLALLVQPVALYALARLSDPVNTLAAWPVLFQILLIARAPALAMPEVIIALAGRATSADLTRFATRLTVLVLVGMVIFVATPLFDGYLDVVQRVPASVAGHVRLGIWWTVAFPALTVIAFALRGSLISRRQTAAINSAMILNLALTAAVMLFGVSQQWPGIPTAVHALNLAVLAEILFLWRKLRVPVS